MPGLLKEIWLHGATWRSGTEVSPPLLPTELVRQSAELHHGVPIFCRTASNWRPGRGDSPDDESATLRCEGHCGQISFCEEEEIRTAGLLGPLPLP